MDLNILKWSIFILRTTIFTACPNSYFPLTKRSFFTIVFICCFGLLQIYTDWANHYLEKAKNKHTISDLQQDVSDGVLLAEVIEAVSKCPHNLLLKVNCRSLRDITLTIVNYLCSSHVVLFIRVQCLYHKEDDSLIITGKLRNVCLNRGKLYLNRWNKSESYFYLTFMKCFT